LEFNVRNELIGTAKLLDISSELVLNEIVVKAVIVSIRAAEVVEGGEATVDLDDSVAVVEIS
jgi:hypothetical protein